MKGVLALAAIGALTVIFGGLWALIALSMFLRGAL